MSEAAASSNVIIIAIVALLPLTALLLVLQTNPYRALIVRGVLGAIAALTYALFGASDVALTEALVGTLLSMTLYAIAIRSSAGFSAPELSVPNLSATDLSVPDLSTSELTSTPSDQTIAPGLDPDTTQNTIPTPKDS